MVLNQGQFYILDVTAREALLALVEARDAANILQYTGRLPPHPKAKNSLVQNFNSVEVEKAWIKPNPWACQCCVASTKASSSREARTWGGRVSRAVVTSAPPHFPPTKR